MNLGTKAEFINDYIEGFMQSNEDRLSQLEVEQFQEEILRVTGYAEGYYDGLTMAREANGKAIEVLNQRREAIALCAQTIVGDTQHSRAQAERIKEVLEGS